MGNAYVGNFCPAQSIENIINDGGGLQQLLLRRDLESEDIHLNNRKFASDKSYTILFDDQIPTDNYLIMLFPCHTDKTKRVLRTCNYRSIVKLNREINQRLSESLSVSFDYETSNLVIITSNLLYKVYNVVGTAYILWCKYVNVMNHNNVICNVLQNFPVFVHMDGYNVFQDVLLIKNHKGDTPNTPLNVARCKFLVPIETFLWTNEHDPRRGNTPTEKINVMTTQEAIDACSDDIEEDIIQESIQKEQLPFSVLITSDAETTNEIEEFSDGEYELTLEAPTPRHDQIFSTFAGTDYKGPDERIEL